MTELIQHLLHTQPADQSVFHSSESIDRFVHGINEQIAGRSRITPFSHPAFFTYFYLGSLFTLKKAGLMEKLGAEDLWYKIKGDDRIIVAYKKKFGPVDEQLAIRLIENGASEESEVRLTNREMEELVSKSGINLVSRDHFDLAQNIDYKIVRYDYKEEKYVYNPLDETEILAQLEHVDQQASLVRDDVFDSIHAEPTEGDQNRFFNERLNMIHSELHKVVQSSAQDVVNQIRRPVLEHKGNIPLIDNHIKQSGFVAGALILDLQQRFNLDCFINEPSLLDKKILLNLVSKSNTLDGWKTNIPVVIESSDSRISETVYEERFQSHVKNNGLEMHPGLQNDQRLAAYVLFNIYDEEVHSDHFPVKPYKGIVEKIMDHNDQWTVDGGIDHTLLERDLKREIDYASNELNLKENPSSLHNMILGQVIGLDKQDVNDRFRFNYLSDSIGDQEILKQSVKSYIISTQEGKRLININLIDTSLPQAKKISSLFTGDHFMMFPTGGRSQYSMINVNLLQDQHGKVNVVTRHQKIDTKPYEEHYSLLNQEKSIPENEAFMRFSADQNSMFRGYMEDIMGPWYTSSLDYSLHQLLSSGSEKELHAFIHQVLANHGKFINTKQELVALMKGAIMNHAQLLHSPRQNQDALIVKKVHQQEMDDDLEYEVDDDHSISDIFEPIVLIGADFKKTHQSPDQCIKNIERDFRESIYSDLEMAFDEHPIVMAAVINKGTERLDEMVTVRSIDSLMDQQTSFDLMNIDNFDYAFDQCLTRRRKRNAACQITRKNAEEFEIVSQKTDHDRYLNKQNLIKYFEQERNPQQAVDMIKFLNNELEKTGNSNLNSKLQKFASESSIVRKLNKIGQMGHFVTRTFMLKNIVADIFHKNWKGVALNAGFIAGGHLSFVAAEQTEKFALKLIANNKLLTGKILKVASPFVARLTSVYNIYDLYQNIKAYKAVGIINDASFLAVDVLELAEAFGIVAGAGPVGSAIAAVVFVGTDIYTSVKAVNKVDEIIHLTASEKMKEGIQSFFGLGIDEYFTQMKDEKLINEALVRQKIDFLSNSDVHFYVFSVELGYTDGKFKDNNILLTENDKSEVCWNRARPENVPKNFTLMCFTHTPIKLSKVDMTYSYIAPIAMPLLPLSGPTDSHLDCQTRLKCDNAIGIAKKDVKSKGCKSIIQIGNGIDRVEGMPQCHNTFIIGNGEKDVNGGENGNTFILNSNSTTGKISGRGAWNIIDLEGFAQNYTGSLDVHIESTFAIKSTAILYINNVFDVIGRRGRADRIICHCRTSFVNGNGAPGKPLDFIELPKSDDCFYNMTIVLSSHVKVISKAQHGELKFLVNNEPGKMIIMFANSSRTKNIFSLNFGKTELKRIKKVKGKLVLYLTKCTVIISRIKLHQSVFKFIDDGSELKIDHHGQHSLFVRSEETNIDHLIYQYGNLAEKLGVFVAIFLVTINQTVFIGHGNKAILSKNNHHAVNIIPNDPDHVSHLYAGKTSVVFEINFAGNREASTAVIHTTREEVNCMKTIDLKKLSQSLPISHALDIEILPDNLDMHLHISDKSPNATRIIGTVILKNALPWYKNFHIIRDQAPLAIKVGRIFTLVPVPLVIPANVDKMLINPKDVEFGTEIIIQKSVKTLSFFKYAKVLIVTDYELSKSSSNQECAQKLGVIKSNTTLARSMASLLCPSTNDRSIFAEDVNSNITSIIFQDYFSVQNYQKSKIISDNRSFDLSIENVRKELMPYKFILLLEKLRFNDMLRQLTM